ncbi:MAG: tetratricopeptide repeat protein [Candidatus Brachytrichaceae bacterium NZ_4S206]|jgi:DNA-binding MarR family transcriptional regulator
MTNILQAAAAIEHARAIQPLERQILRALRERGPGLPLEVAVRVLKFPEEIAPALQDLSARGLIQAERFGGSLLGDELLSLTPLGAQTLEAAEALEQQRVTAAGERSVAIGGAVSESNIVTGTSGATAAGHAASARVAVTEPDAEPARPSIAQQEAELLQKLGDVAAKAGDTAKASEYYEQALKLVRRLRDAAAS